MTAPSKSYLYSVEFDVHVVDAPSTRLKNNGDLYINICLLGTHKRTSLVPSQFPMHIDQRLYFEKVFKSCAQPRDILQRLEREHVLIELLQANRPSPTLLASYETNARDFLHPYSSDRMQSSGPRRYALLSRTVDFPGVSPSFEFSIHTSIDQPTGRNATGRARKQPKKPTASYGNMPKRSKSPTPKPPNAFVNRSSLDGSPQVSRSLTSHTISSAVKNDHAQRATQDKLRELAIQGQVKYVVQLDKTAGRQPFVVRHVNDNLIGRKPKSHVVLNDGLVINDYSMSRSESPLNRYSLDDGNVRSRSMSPVNNRSMGSGAARSYSPARSQRLLPTSRSMDFDDRSRSRTPQQRASSPTTPPYGDHDYHHQDDELHSTKVCDICRLHRLHSEQSQRAKSLEQQRFTTASNRKSYSPDFYSGSASRHLTSPILARDTSQSQYRQSSTGDLSDKVIQNLRRNLESYSEAPRYGYYSSYRYSDEH